MTAKAVADLESLIKQGLQEFYKQRIDSLKALNLKKTSVVRTRTSFEPQASNEPLKLCKTC